MKGKRIRAVISWLLAAALFLKPVCIWAEETDESVESQTLVEAPSAVLMEAQTGTIIFQKDMDTRRSPASVTKIMTLILIFDAIENGALKLADSVTTSAYAKSMGGSQVFLEEGETQSVETMIKCIVIASGNDASVAMAEHIAGSEQEFVRQMNAKAKELGMENTNFEDCCGLTDSPSHYTTARDIAVMSRELITKYPQVLEYSSIWMEDIVHETRKGSSKFTLANTNKLLRSFEGCVGLKTGSTSVAKYCLSAVAKRDGITLISVVMAAPNYKIRFKDAASMLNYGFSRCSLYVDEKQPKLPGIKVEGGVEDTVFLQYEGKFQYLSTEGKELSDIKKKLVIPKEVKAPVKKGEKAGEMRYYIGEEKLGSVPVLYEKSVEKAVYKDYIKRMWEAYLL